MNDNGSVLVLTQDLLLSTLFEFVGRWALAVILGTLIALEMFPSLLPIEAWFAKGNEAEAMKGVNNKALLNIMLSSVLSYWIVFKRAIVRD